MKTIYTVLILEVVLFVILVWGAVSSSQQPKFGASPLDLTWNETEEGIWYKVYTIEGMPCVSIFKL